MDPFTILQAASAALSTSKGAWDLASGLYNFFQGAKNFDRTAEALESEVKALATACNVVGKRLESVVQDKADGHGLSSKKSVQISDYLWVCVQEQIYACQKTVEELQDTVRVTQRGKGMNIFRRMRSQVNLNLQAPDITESRDRIRSHTASLNLILASITIDIVYLSPRHADSHLQAELATVKEEKQKLERLRTQRGSQSDRANEAAILKASERIISGGSTLYAESLASESLLGASSEAKSRRTHEWIEHTDALANQESKSSAADETEFDSVFSSPNVAETDFTETSSNTPPEPSVSGKAKLNASVPDDEDDESDSGDEFSYEAAQYAIEAGREAFEKSDYTDASATLQEALRLVRELPVHRQTKICDSNEVRYMLAVCSFHLEDPESAKIALISILDHMPNAKSQDNKRRSQVCDAGQMLAEVCIKLGELEQARTYCDSAMHGRRRLLGKTDNATYDSLALMVRILHLQGKDSRARIFAKMLPETHKSKSEPTEEDRKGPSAPSQRMPRKKVPDISGAILKDIQEDATAIPVRPPKGYAKPTVTDEDEPVASNDNADQDSAKAETESAAAPQSPPLSPAESFKESGNKYYKIGEYDSAIAEYSKAIECDPTTWTFYTNRAAAYMAMKQYQNAMQDCVSADKLSPHNPKISARITKIYALIKQEAT